MSVVLQNLELTAFKQSFEDISTINSSSAYYEENSVEYDLVLRLLRTFAGVVGEKFRMRVILKKNMANYI